MDPLSVVLGAFIQVLSVGVQVKDLHFLDTEACYWQLALQHSMQYRAHSKAGLPHLGATACLLPNISLQTAVSHVTHMYTDLRQFTCSVLHSI